NRMAHLTRQLLAYSRQGAYERTVLSFNDAISEAIALTHKGPASAIEAKLHLQQDLWPVFADPGQLGQLLASLLTNAFEAMEAGAGRLTVLTENIRGKAAWECRLKHHHQGGDYVHLRLTDTGHGIPAEIQPRVFEPFFTTKFMGRGLGLASALGIVQNHGGCISAESAPGQGATFDVYLPRHAATPGDPEPREQPKARAARKILVVDDEETVLALLQSLLTALGYEPIPAESGAQALALFTPQRKNIALAILDIQMEGMDGKQLARELKTIEPGIKVLISSGYDEQTALSGLEHQHYDGFIHKPFWLNDLKAKLQTLLES
ncbi:MAG: response regulator, partial [Legionella sp.]|nr:response regulator [Legionella sp.]